MKPIPQQNWKEPWVDRMGLIVALSGETRFQALQNFKQDAKKLSPFDAEELIECLRQRFTPSNGTDGCVSAMSAVRSAAESVRQTTV